jgi:troponin T
MSSDEEDERSESEPEQSSEPTEAELALKKRREAQKTDSKGLDESAKELLQSNKEERQRMEDEISELRQRNERRKKEREIEEKRLAAERIAEEERRKAAEEEKRRKKEEEEDKKKKERSQRMAEFEKLKNPGNKPNFVISKRAEESGGEEAEDEKPGVVRKSKEQMEAERKAILSQRIQPLSTDGLDAGKLAEKARELHKQIFRLESEKYDHEKRFKAQQVDMMELAERARQANKVGRGGLKRVQVGQDDVDDVQARFSGAPAKIEMYSKYERQTDKRPYTEKKNVYGGPTWAMPVERIRPQKIVRWNEEGLPIYEEKGGESEAQAHEEVAA